MPGSWLASTAAQPGDAASARIHSNDFRCASRLNPKPGTIISSHERGEYAASAVSSAKRLPF